MRVVKDGSSLWVRPVRVNAWLNGKRCHNILLSLLLVILGTYRLCVSWSGQLYWPDEFRYLHALHVLDELRKGDVSRAIYWVFGSESGVASRPGFILFSMAPAILQGVGALLLGLQPSDPAFHRIPALSNVLVSLGVALVFYRVVVLLSGDRAVALLGVAVHGFLVNTNEYVRHLFPYDASLLLFLGAVAVLLSPGSRPQLKAVWAGVLSGVGATTYPGYGLFLLVPLSLVCVKGIAAWREGSVFLAGAASVAGLWEAVARVGGYSFVFSSQRFSTTFNFETEDTIQGDYEEGYRFLPLYLFQIEGVAGVALAILLGAFFLMAFRRQFGSKEVVVMIATVVAYLIYATAVVVLHRFLFYGRLVHMYLPMVVMGAVLAVGAFQRSSVRYGVSLVLLISSVLSFAPMAAHALTIRFPKDVMRGLAIAWGPGMTICQLEHEQADDLGSGRSGCDVLVENARHLYPLPAKLHRAPPLGFVLAQEFKHPMQFSPYWFEGYKPEERERLRREPPLIRVYARPGLQLTAKPRR